MPTSRAILLCLCCAFTLEASVASERSKSIQTFRALPLRFERQTANRYVARSTGSSVAIDGNAIRVWTAGAQRPATVRFAGANRPHLAGDAESSSTANYFIGNDPRRWRRNVPTFERVRSRSVYRGIDLLFYGNNDEVEFDIVVAPGADPRAIRMRVDGADRLAIDDHGDLVMHTGSSDLLLKRPAVFQNGKRVEASYRLSGNRSVTFDIGHYDAAKPLVIDPTWSFTQVIGGSGGDQATAIAVDSSGTYMTGWTASTDFPTTFPFQAQSGGGRDVFIVKLSPTGTILYSTYLGGSGDDIANAIAADSTGFYVAGSTTSTNFPTSGALQMALSGSQNGFVTKFDPTGSTLVFSTYYGGGTTSINGIAVDAAHNVYITGSTDSLTTTVNNAQPFYGGMGDAFVAALNPSGSVLNYSTYLGGNDADSGSSIAVGSTGNTFVVGKTQSSNFPTLMPTQPKGGGGPMVTNDSGATWSPANTGFPSGFAQAIAFNPTNAMIVYASGFNDGIAESTDGGATWNLIGLSASDVTSIIVDPTAGSTVYAGADLSDGVYVSTDGGTTFNLMVNGLTHLDVKSMAMDPSNHLKLFAGTLDGVFVTVDGAQHWTTTSLTTGFIRWIAIDPTNPNNVLVANGNAVYKSINGGSTFTTSSSGIPFTPIYQIAIDPGNSANIYAATGSGLYRSTNSGMSWSALHVGDATTPQGKVDIVSFWAKVPQSLVVKGDLGMWETTNGGSTWSRLKPNTPSTAAFAYAPSAPANAMCGTGQTDAFVCTFSPTGVKTYCSYYGGTGDDSASCVAYDAATAHYCVVGTTSSLDEPVTSNAVQQSFGGGACDAYMARFNATTNVCDSCGYVGGSGDDFGDSVACTQTAECTLAGTSTSSNLALVHPVQVFGGATRVFRTFDSGLTWNGRPNIPGPTIVVNPQDSGEVYSWHKGLWKSIDTGVTFTDITGTVTSALTSLDIEGTAVLTMSDSATLYLFAPAGTCKSVDHGTTFSLLPSDNAGLATVAVTMTDTVGNETVIRDWVDGIRRSADGGTSWMSPTGVPSARATDIAVARSAPGVVYAAFNNGIYKSTDYGLTFLPTGVLTNGIAPFHVAIDGSDPNRVYAVSRGAGVYLSVDGGTSWSPANVPGLGSQVINFVTTGGGSPADVFFSADKSLYVSHDGCATIQRSGLANLTPGRVVIGARDPLPGEYAFTGIPDPASTGIGNIYLFTTQFGSGTTPDVNSFSTYLGTAIDVPAPVALAVNNGYVYSLSSSADDGPQSTVVPPRGVSPGGQTTPPRAEVSTLGPGTMPTNDLAITAVAFNPPNPIFGQQFDAMYTFRNNGGSHCSWSSVLIQTNVQVDAVTTDYPGMFPCNKSIDTVTCSFAFNPGDTFHVTATVQAFSPGGAGFEATITNAQDCLPDLYPDNNRRSSYVAVPAPPPPAPTNVTVTLISNSQIDIHWDPQSGVDHFSVRRASSLNSTFSQIGTTTTTSFSDTSPSVVPGYTYVYVLRAVNAASVESKNSAPDYATTISFTNDPLLPGTSIAPIYTLEVRNAAAQLGAAAGMPPPSFTDGSLTGAPIYTYHIQQIRDYMNTALGVIGAPRATFANDPLQPGTPIRASDIEDLRKAAK